MLRAPLSSAGLGHELQRQVCFLLLRSLQVGLPHSRECPQPGLGWPGGVSWRVGNRPWPEPGPQLGPRWWLWRARLLPRAGVPCPAEAGWGHSHLGRSIPPLQLPVLALAGRQAGRELPQLPGAVRRGVAGVGAAPRNLFRDKLQGSQPVKLVPGTARAQQGIPEGFCPRLWAWGGQRVLKHSSQDSLGSRPSPSDPAALRWVSRAPPFPGLNGSGTSLRLPSRSEAVRAERRREPGSPPAPCLACHQGRCALQTCLRRPAMLPAAPRRQGPGPACRGE